MGLELNAKFDAGNFHARGYDGNDKMDHCAHIGLLRDVFKSHLKPRWKTPKGLAKKVEKPKPEKVAAKADKPKADKPKAADKKRDGKKAPDKKKGADPPRAKTAQR
jgi:hypothetical protein